jgi:quinol monooxygenase YgiN
MSLIFIEFSQQRSYFKVCILLYKITIMGRIVIVAYKPKPGKADVLKELTKTHVPRLHKEGLVTHREPVIVEAADGTIIEVFEWLSAEAIQQAHQNPEVHKMWAEYAEVCDYIPLKELPETANLFADFTALN